jgi:PqqD family protein of HPr-rel-A system
MRWRVHSRGRFYDANEDTVVYFDSHSGDTHLLSDFAAYIIQQLADHPLTVDELIDRISPNVESSVDAGLNQAVQAVLDELVSLEIVNQN